MMRNMLGLLTLGFIAAPVALGLTTNDDAEPVCDCAGDWKIAIITHALEGTGSDFWNTWKRGSFWVATNMDVGISWYASGYDADKHVALTKEVCEKGYDGFGITLPFAPGTPEYIKVDDAINACLASNPSITVYTINTDTYTNPNIVGYVGATNANMGRICAADLITGGYHDAVSDRLNDIASYILPNPEKVLIYFSEDEAKNYGIQVRKEAMQQVYKNFGIPIELTNSLEDVKAARAEGYLIVGMGVGATIAAEADYNCGDDMMKDIRYSGQSVYSQGSSAAFRLIQSAKGGYEGVFGNSINAAIDLSKGDILVRTS